MWNWGVWATCKKGKGEVKLLNGEEHGDDQLPPETGKLENGSEKEGAGHGSAKRGGHSTSVKYMMGQRD